MTSYPVGSVMGAYVPRKQLQQSLHDFQCVFHCDGMRVSCVRLLAAAAAAATAVDGPPCTTGKQAASLPCKFWPVSAIDHAVRCNLACRQAVQSTGFNHTTFHWLLTCPWHE